MPDFSVITQYIIYIATVAGATLALIKGTITLTDFLAILGGISLGHATATTVAAKKLTKLALQVPVGEALPAPTQPVVMRDPQESVPAQ